MRGRREQTPLEQHRPGNRHANDDQLPHQLPVHPPEAAQHAIFLERAARVADPHRRDAHGYVHERGRKTGAEQVEARQSVVPVNERIGEQRVDRDGGKRDPQRRLRTIDRAHEVAQRDEAPGRDHRPGKAEQIAGGERSRFVRLSGSDEDVFAPQLNDVDRDAEDDRGPQAHAQRPPHHAWFARAVGLRRQRRHRRNQAHAEHEADRTR